MRSALLMPLTATPGPAVPSPITSDPPSCNELLLDIDVEFARAGFRQGVVRDRALSTTISRNSLMWALTSP